MYTLGADSWYIKLLIIGVTTGANIHTLLV